MLSVMLMLSTASCYHYDLLWRAKVWGASRSFRVHLVLHCANFLSVILFVVRLDPSRRKCKDSMFTIGSLKTDSILDSFHPSSTSTSYSRYILLCQLVCGRQMNVLPLQGMACVFKSAFSVASNRFSLLYTASTASNKD